MKIQSKIVSNHQIILEIFYSAQTLIIYCLSSWITFKSYKAGITKIYLDTHQYGMVYFFLSILVMILVHDAYFYWTHRFIHLRWVFKIVHRVHHLSHNPTPWASLSFHPLEAIISLGIIPIIIFLIPCHPFALTIFLSIMMATTVMGHLGYETFSRKFINHSIGKFQNNATNHNLHHQFTKHNYGLYFTFWDKWMGTYK